MSQFDNPEGWEFENAFAGPGYLFIKKGGSITTPALSNMVGNAQISFSTGFYYVPSRFPEGEPDKGDPNKVYVIGSGTVNNDVVEDNVAMAYSYLYDGASDTRLKLVAGHDITLTSIYICYGGVGNAREEYENLIGYSHAPGEYFNPFDVVLTPWTSGINDDGSHNYTVYTLDGTEPKQTSARYDGTPIHISETTTLRAGTVYGSGLLFCDTPQVYKLTTASAEYRPDEVYDVVNTPGSLKNKLLAIDADVLEGVRIKGKMNGADLAYLVSAEGRMSELKYIDMSEVTFDYDGSRYRTVVDAPEAGMGTVYTYHYILSAENSDERIGGSPTSEINNVYRNNLAAAFYRHPNIRTVILPETLTEIGERAFAQCPELVTVRMSDNIKAVGSSAFNNSKQEIFNLPASLEKIGAYAFATSILGNVKFSKKVELGEGAFAGCNVETVEFTVPVDTIPYALFGDCNNLRKLVIADGTRYIDRKAFAGTQLSEVIIPSSVTEIAGDAFERCPFVDKIEPEGGIRYIGAVAYRLADDTLSEYTIKPGTVTIADGLFAWKAATVFNIPASVEIIGVEAFAGTQITRLPEMPGVKRINSGAFYACPKLAKVTIPETVEYINYPFRYCNAMWSMTYNAINAECEEGLVPRELDEIIIGDKVKRIPSWLYNGNSSITEVVLPASVEIIDPYAFSQCKTLKTITGPGKLTSIGEEAFSWCSALESIMPLDVVEVPWCAFRECTSLKAVELSDRTEEIGRMAFAYCHELTDFHWPLSLKAVESGAFTDCNKLTVVSLPEGCEYLADNFYGCKALKKVYIPSTLLPGENETAVGLMFDGEDKGAVYTCMLATPPVISYSGWKNLAQIKVPAEALAAYKNAPGWKNYADIIVPVGELNTAHAESTTDFSNAIKENDDLSDTMLESMYLTLGDEDEFDSADGAIVLNSAMTDEKMEAVAGMAPGKSDIANRFNGIVVNLSTGHGSVTIDCRTIGSRQLSVKIGDNDPVHYTQSAKGEIKVDYNVPENTFLYIYASDTDSGRVSVSRRIKEARDASGSVRIYAVNIKPVVTSVEGIEMENSQESPITDYYTLSGEKINCPTEKGIYIVRRADGTASKHIVR